MTVIVAARTKDKGIVLAADRQVTMGMQKGRARSAETLGVRKLRVRCRGEFPDGAVTSGSRAIS